MYVGIALRFLELYDVYLLVIELQKNKRIN